MKNIFLLLIFYSLFFQINAQAQSWSEVGVGNNALNANNSISLLAADTSGNIYAAGYFTDSTGLYYVAKFDGTKWIHVGAGLNSPITAMTFDNLNNLYVGGEFLDTLSHSYFVAKWNGSCWNNLGTGNLTWVSSNYVQAITTDKFGNIYVTGSVVDSSLHPTVAKFDGTNWSELGTGANALHPNYNIYTLLCDDAGNVYAAGGFTDSVSNHKGSMYVAKWNGTSWSELGTGSFGLNIFGAILTLEKDNAGNIYAAGTFSDDSGKIEVVKWNGNYWSELGSIKNNLPTNTGDYIVKVKVSRVGDIYLACERLYSQSFSVAKWNGTSWDDLAECNNGLKPNNEVLSLALDNAANIYVAGDFTDSVASNKGHRYVAKYTAATGVEAVKNCCDENMLVYPNPTSSVVNLTFGDAKNRAIKLYDINGKLLFSTNIFTEKYQFALDKKFGNGIYILQINDENNFSKKYRIVKIEP